MPKGHCEQLKFCEGVHSHHKRWTLLSEMGSGVEKILLQWNIQKAVTGEPEFSGFPPFQ